MEDSKKNSDSSGFMQGWGFIILIIAGVIAALVALKLLMG